MYVLRERRLGVGALITNTMSTCARRRILEETALDRDERPRAYNVKVACVYAYRPLEQRKGAGARP